MALFLLVVLTLLTGQDLLFVGACLGYAVAQWR